MPTIEFVPANSDYLFNVNKDNYTSEPEPSINFLPEWYKKLSRFGKSNNITKLQSKLFNITKLFYFVKSIHI